MKSSSWWGAVMAHYRAMYGRGQTITVTVGDVATLMGCSNQTAKKHLKWAVGEDLAAAEYSHVKGCINRIEVSFRI